MKLYATITSERASKGQGGNKFLNITIQRDAKKRIPTFFVGVYENELVVEDIRTGKEVFRETEYLKGEKQKGEHKHLYIHGRCPCGEES